MIFLCSNYLIPSGKYGHSNKEIIDNLKDLKIYRINKDGSIMFKINNILKTEKCET